jgi:hypothetical protein
MIPASKPANEQQRLEDLYSFNVLDTAAERDFDELADLAAMICGTSMSAVTLSIKAGSGSRRALVLQPREQRARKRSARTPSCSRTFLSWKTR